MGATADREAAGQQPAAGGMERVRRGQPPDKANGNHDGRNASAADAPQLQRHGAPGGLCRKAVQHSRGGRVRGELHLRLQRPADEGDLRDGQLPRDVHVRQPEPADKIPSAQRRDEPGHGLHVP